MGAHEEGILRRGLGVLLGQATGDALGTTVEFQDTEDVRRAHPHGLREIVGGGPFRVLPGQVTDDTELALALARSLAGRGTYDADAVAEAYVAWHRSDPFDVGTTTRRAFGPPLVPGERPACQLERRADSKREANGSLMRASPLGVFGWRLDADGLAAVAAQDSRLSHASPGCQAACVVFTYAIAYAVRTGDEPRAVYESTLDFARRTPLAAPVLVELEHARTDGPVRFDGPQQGWVRIALQNAFHRLVTADGFEDGVVATVTKGGDADTNGAIAGALLGSVHGADAVPRRWRDAVLACRSRRPAAYQCTDLPDLARRLCFPTRSPGEA